MMKEKTQQMKEKALANPKVQELMENDKFQKAVIHAPLAYRILIIFLFVMPLFTMWAESSCYAMDRPDYFWPVGENTQDTESYSVYNVSAKFQWIFFLGLVTHVITLGLEKFEEKQKEKFENMEFANSKQYEEEHIKKDKMEKNLKIAKMALFIFRILFLVWIMGARYSHVGKVCSGDFNGYDVVKAGSNYSKGFDYTYLGFPGWVMKLYVWIFMGKLFFQSTLALWLGTDWDPEDYQAGGNADDNYGRVSGSFSSQVDNEANNRRSSKYDERNHRDMFDSPGQSPARKSIGGGTSPGKFQKQKPTDFEMRVQEKMKNSFKAKVEGRKYSSKERSSSKKGLQKSMNNFKK